MHLDHDNCIESVFLRGPTEVVRRFAESIVAEKGVRHGKVNLIPVDNVVATHEHGRGHGQGRRHKHEHARPRT